MGRNRKYNTKEELSNAKKLARKKYVLKNKDKVLEQQKKWKERKFGVKIKLTEEEKKQRTKHLARKWQLSNLDKCRLSSKKWRLNNPEKARDQHNRSVKRRKEKNPLFKLTCRVRTIMSKSISRNGYKKGSKTEEILGCSFEYFKQYLESKFEPWMNWDNYGRYNGGFNYGWDIDHITPVSTGINESEIIKLNHYTNLQPLCSKINREIKLNKVITN